jgi:hypothetical protein
MIFAVLSLPPRIGAVCIPAPLLWPDSPLALSSSRWVSRALLSKR